ncbi:hypothetical protein [Oceanobacillus locisalsi]|uniref:YceG-like family protein n=1 Tax=Oceanobacillus locisalsi TaxID=546107 RepID=A0ABW3NF34_9BACI
MKQHVRAFAIGLLTSGILLLAIYLFGNSSSGNLEDTEPEELISVLENQGYAVLTQDEYIAYSVDQEDAEEADSDAENGDESDTNDDSADDEDNNDENSNNEENSNDEDSNGNEENDTEGNEDDASSEDSDVVEAEITLEDDAPPSTISNALEDEGIIDDAWDFNEYLEDNDLSGSVIPGTYEIDSDMSFSEISDIITTYSED